MGLDEAIEAEAQAQAICMQTQDFHRAYQAFAEEGKTRSFRATEQWPWKRKAPNETFALLSRGYPRCVCRSTPLRNHPKSGM